MFRTFVILGGVIDVLFAFFLLLVFGWVLDSWHDPLGTWVGVVVTSIWAVAFALSAGAAIVGYILSRRRSSLRRVALAVWLPPLLLVAVTMAGFVVFSGN